MERKKQGVNRKILRFLISLLKTVNTALKLQGEEVSKTRE
jgi:hypothetical protein